MNNRKNDAGAPQRPGTALLALLAAAVGIGLLVVVPIGAYYECGGGARCHPELAFIVLAVLLAAMLAYAARRISRDMATHSAAIRSFRAKTGVGSVIIAVAYTLGKIMRPRRRGPPPRAR